MFCPNSSTASYTLSELKTVKYGGTSVFNTLPPTIERSTNGLLTPASTKLWIDALNKAGIFPTPPSQKSFETAATAASSNNTQNAAIQQYVDLENQFVIHIKNEYCFYEQLYKYSLRQLLNKIVQSNTSSAESIKTDINEYLTLTVSYGGKLNDIITLINAITEERLRYFKDKSADLNTLNTTLQQRSENIKAQAAILKDKSGTEELYKRMMEYSNEKNRANNNLLSLYSFLNIVALGMLVYVYRAA
jgi:hypothetical protein